MRKEISITSERNLSDKEILDVISDIISQKKELDIYSTDPQYSVKELADMLGTSVHTIRFYDKEHLFPFVRRDDSNERLFSHADMAYGKMILCLRRLGLSIHDCRLFILDTMEGDDTVTERLKILLTLQKELKRKMEKMDTIYQDLQYKIRFYSHLDSVVKKEKEQDQFQNKNRGTLSKLHEFIIEQKSFENTI